MLKLKLKELYLIKMTNKTNEEKAKGKLIYLDFCRDEKPIIYIKACKEFEEWLKNNKELTTISNYLGTNTSKEVYKNRIDQSYSTDDINATLFYSGKLNRAILRTKGISKGLEIPLKSCGLINIENVEKEIKDLLRFFKQFYKDNIQKVNIIGSLETTDI